MTGIHFSKEVAENPVPFPAATMWAKKIDSSAARRECHVKPQRGIEPAPKTEQRPGWVARSRKSSGEFAPSAGRMSASTGLTLATEVERHHQGG